MKINYHCTYCGIEFEEEYYSSLYAKQRCPHCNDDKLEKIMNNVDRSDVYGYNTEDPKEDAYFIKEKK